MGGGRGKVGQVQKLITNSILNPFGKPVILYAPNISAGCAKYVQKAGGIVVKSISELLNELGGS